MAALHVMAGKAGSGKTTFARALAKESGAVVICEDHWISALGDPITDLSQYVSAAGRIRRIAAPLTTELLRLGVSVVFDFAGNTKRDRLWTYAVARQGDGDHVIHYLEADEGLCRERVLRRNVERPAGVFYGVVTVPQLEEVNRHFSPPGDNEGFAVISHKGDGRI